VLRIIFESEKLPVCPGFYLCWQLVVRSPEVFRGTVLHLFTGANARALFVVYCAVDGFVEATGCQVGFDAEIERAWTCVLIEPNAQLFQFVLGESPIARSMSSILLATMIGTQIATDILH